MASSKRKPGRNPLQRLSDQRRSLVLAGLAVGAALSAAIFRRRRAGEEAALEPPPPAAPPATQPDSGPPPVAEVPPPAAPESPPPAAGRPAASPPPTEPATGELSAEEASILSVLAQSGRGDEQRTALTVATSLEREVADVSSVLRKLGAEGVVSGELYTATGEKIWAVTERGVRRLGAQS